MGLFYLNGRLWKALTALVAPAADGQDRLGRRMEVVGLFSESKEGIFDPAVDVHPSMGAKSDAPASGTGDASLIALAKGMLASLQSSVAALDVVIASGQSLSAEIDLADKRLIRIAMPAAWTAADLTFQTSFDGVAFNDLYDEFGVEVVVKAAAGRSIRLNVTDWLGVKKLKIRSGTTATPVAQAAARTLKTISVY